MTAATTTTLLPLAPKTVPANSPLTSKLTTMSANPLPLVRPQSLLLYPEVLARATMADTLLKQQQRPLLQTTSLDFANYATANHMSLQQQLTQHIQRELNNSMRFTPPSLVSPVTTTSLLKKDIIGMGIAFPSKANGGVPGQPLAHPLQGAPKTTKSKTPQDSLKKMMMIGNPLRAPPPLFKKIYHKRPAAPKDPSSPAAPNKRRRVVSYEEATKKTNLSADELEFLRAAKQLHAIHACPLESSHQSLTNQETLTNKALKPPPMLGR